MALIKAPLLFTTVAQAPENSPAENGLFSFSAALFWFFFGKQKEQIG
jgi:hypothetical protein